MASFEEHICQAKSNLLFLTEVNKKFSANWDWQVTISFYVAVHLINSHLATKADLHYKTHSDVKNSINPYNSTAVFSVPQDVYLSYVKLEGLSRRARYLCHDDTSNSGDNKRSHTTYDKHFAKAIKNLDRILKYFVNEYYVDFGKLEISCVELNSNSGLLIFKVV